MVTRNRPTWFLVFTAVNLSLPVLSAISTSTPTPPLQWLNITRLLSGSGAPPLKGASIGYDETVRTLIVFGGESESGFPTSTTYLLNLDSLIWSVPQPTNGLVETPPPRSRAISGFDWAANQRQCHIVIGGLGANGGALSDVWEYDYLTQYWSSVALSPGGPSARWGAAGGNDRRVTYLATAGLNNSFYLSGGQNKDSISPLSDVWRLNVSGTVSPNNPNQVFGSWESLSISGTLPSMQGLAGTVISQQIISSGGCNSTTPANNDDGCAVGDSFIISTSSGSPIAPPSCPVPRYEGVMVPNMNTASSSFSSQAFLLLGTFDSNKWNDAGGLSKGEIAILDTNTGSWARILPAGDPSSVSPYPSPRSGATAVAYQQALIGGSRTGATDTIVFGGQDANGKYLSEIWVLRAYNGVITKSGESWTGFGNGQLQSGQNASGTGVTNSYMDTCATQINTPQPSSTTTHGDPSPTSTGTPNNAIVQSYNVSILHKILAPLSVALVLPAVLVYRIYSPSLKSSLESPSGPSSMFAPLIPGFIIFGLGIAGLVSSFTSISHNQSLAKRADSSLYLQTAHGIAGVVLAAAFYVAVPVVFLCSLFLRHRSGGRGSLSQDEAEKLAARSPPPSTAMLDGTLDRQHSPNHSRSHSSTGLLQFWRRSADRSRSSDTEGDEFGVRDAPSPGQSRGFEVVNRSKHTRGASSQSMSGFIDHGIARPQTPTRLGEISWLNRRRMVNTVGDLDYALTQITRTSGPMTPNTTDVLLNRESMTSARSFPPPPVKYPSPLEAVFHIIFHALLLALCTLCLVQLWRGATLVAFAIFLVWTVGFYIAMVALAWNGRPGASILAVTLSRLRARPSPHNASLPPHPGSRPMSSTTPEPSTFTQDLASPYLHSPPFRAIQGDEYYDMMSTGRHHEDGEDDPYDDEDEETRQQRIEGEMSRRDVSIVTVPKRKLWVANPT